MQSLQTFEISDLAVEYVSSNVGIFLENIICFSNFRHTNLKTCPYFFLLYSLSFRSLCRGYSCNRTSQRYCVPTFGAPMPYSVLYNIDARGLCPEVTDAWAGIAFYWLCWERCYPRWRAGAPCHSKTCQSSYNSTRIHHLHDGK